MESAEHVWIGDQISLQFNLGSVPAKGHPLALPQLDLPAGSALTYGQVLALGGDFYGVVGAPISTAADPGKAFWNAFLSLGGNWDETQQILAIMQKEIDAVNAAIAAGKPASSAYAELGDSLSMQWNVVTGGENVGGLPVKSGRYLALAAENWDHFAPYAVTAYSAGHAAAMTYAASIPHDLPATEYASLLGQAYLINAFADHFLTDLFSAGHLRVPRKELYEQVTTPIPNQTGTLGSLLARCMHDEDSRNGLNVVRATDSTVGWMAYGDKRLLDSVSARNSAMVVEATQVSANDVWNAALDGSMEYTALRYIPDLARVLYTDTRENYSPLFKSVDFVAQVRSDVTNRSDFSWTADWWGWSTYAAIKASESHAFVPVKCYNLESGQFLGWLGVGTNNYAVLVSNVQDAAGLVWYVDGNDLYLRKVTSPFDRYLGEGVSSYADWGLWGGNYKSAVVYNDDTTVSMKGAPNRKLYVYKGDQLCWSNGESDLPFVFIDLPFSGQNIS